ncbi:hypothetical protein LZ30DRAFT_479719 [Colletotrichum cereale]|nr:hypothetical protein LZ30DRAFT_479719 [Colletotrichum cereale]
MHVETAILPLSIQREGAQVGYLYSASATGRQPERLPLAPELSLIVFLTPPFGASDLRGSNNNHLDVETFIKSRQRARIHVANTMVTKRRGPGVRLEIMIPCRRLRAGSRLAAAPPPTQPSDNFCCSCTCCVPQTDTHRYGRPPEARGVTLDWVDILVYSCTRLSGFWKQTSGYFLR